MNYLDLCEYLVVGGETNFFYNNKEYEFVYSARQEADGKIYLYLACNEPQLWQKISFAYDKGGIIKFLETYKIGNKTIKQIFEEGLNY